MKSITEKILKSKQGLKTVNLIDKFPAYIASFFSIIFALSIVLELKEVIEGYVLTFLTFFITLFLVFNEELKVRKIKGFIKGDNKVFPTLAFTFIISCSLSCLGIFFWINKSQELEDANKIKKSEETAKIYQHHKAIIDSLRSALFDDLELRKEIAYWKSRRNATIEERKENRSRVESFQKALREEKKDFNSKKEKMIKEEQKAMQFAIQVLESQYSRNNSKLNRNNFITWIFFIMVLITEFAIISLNKNISKKEIAADKLMNSDISKRYRLNHSVVKELFLVHSKGDRIDINAIKYLQSVKTLECEDSDDNWKCTKQVYNLLISLGVISEPRGKYKTSEVLEDAIVAEGRVNNYFEKVFELV